MDPHKHGSMIRDQQVIIMGKPTPLEALMQRQDATRVKIINPQQLPVELYAREDVFLDGEGVRQLLDFLSLQDTIKNICQAQRAGQISPFFDLDDDAAHDPGFSRVVLTPDFHKGGGIPVGTVAMTRGFVIPQAVGNDICCGMRMIVTELRREELEPVMPQLLTRLRQLFFEGQRDLPMSPNQRRALLTQGLWGLYESRHDNANVGLWRRYDDQAQLEALERVHFEGSLAAPTTFAFDDYIRASGAVDARDSQMGSVGGGNHFVEVQCVEELLDGATAHAWGVREGAVTIMAHSGSVGLGHTVGGYFKDLAKKLYPKGLAHPEHGFYPLPTRGPLAHHAKRYLDAMANAANFAFANRLFLGLMVIQAMEEVLGRTIEHKLLYDAPHNLIWANEGGPDSDLHLHRKGACPAYGPSPSRGDSAFRYTGPPVIIPGSMGDSSYLMAGRGNPHALCSACHGAGRMLPRGVARHIDQETFTKQVKPLHVVSPIDPDSPQVRLRRDVLQQHHDRLAEEGPYAYKPITPVVQTVEDAQIAGRVARLWPLLTIKG